MSERDEYPAGVPCWVATISPEPERAAAFYTELFGWEAEDLTDGDASDRFFLFKLRGRAVAGAGSTPQGPGRPADAAWSTFVAVDSADDAAARVAAAGGSVLMEPFDALEAGRVAVLADPAGAVFRVWQPRAAAGAQLINEPCAWSWSQLNTRDPDGARAFYETVFGWKAERFEVGGGAITLWSVPGYLGGEPEQPVSRDVVAGMAPMSDDAFPPGFPSHWSIDFWVADVDETAGRAAALGGTVVAAPFDTSIARTAVLADPQRAAFSISRVHGHRP